MIELEGGTVEGESRLPDMAAYWMPFTNNRAFKAQPRLFQAAEGMYYWTPERRKVLDGTAGLWCVNAGHGNPHITQRIREQAGILDYAPSFQLGHPGAFELATRLVGILPPGLNHVFFTDSGSEGADTALKMALAYHRARGQSGRIRLIGRQRGYHGTNFGGTSVGGIPGNRRSFGAQVWGVDHLSHTFRPAAAFSRGLPEVNDDLAEELEGIVELHGAETVAAVIVEPVACSAGVLVPPRNYLQRLRQITARHGILLIFDEVITAFGRLGRATASDYFGVVPDILSMAKGLTNGTVPMGAVAASDDIHDTIISAAAAGIEFPHGYTYSGHPLAAAAGIATLDVYRDEDLFARAAALADYWEDACHSLHDAPHVTDIRNLGLMAGIELAARVGAPGQRAAAVFQYCFDQGVLVRASGDVIALSPPLIVNRAQIDEIIGRLREALDKVP